MSRITIDYLGDEPVRVELDGTPKKLSPLQRNLVATLAESDSGFTTREALLRELQVDQAGLYRLVYATRQRLGDRELIAQIGSSSRRKSRRPVGCSGYALSSEVVLRRRP